MNHFADEFMSHDSSVVQANFTAEEWVQIAAAQAGNRNADNRVSWLLNDRIWKFSQLDVANVLKANTDQVITSEKMEWDVVDDRRRELQPSGSPLHGSC